jgi:hypothetical protein
MSQVRTKFCWSWAGGQNKVLLVLGRIIGAHREDWVVHHAFPFQHHASSQWKMPVLLSNL